MSYNFDAAVSPFIKALPPSGLAKFLDIMAANPNIVPLSVGEPDFVFRRLSRMPKSTASAKAKAAILPLSAFWSCAK